MLFPLYGRRGSVRLALGLHPLEVQKVDLDSELTRFQSYAGHTSYIGEIGLDFSPDGRATRAKQERALGVILATSGVPEKLMTLHSRGAARDVIAALRSAGATRAILHWYSGALRDLDDALVAGFYFSINPSMTRSTKGQKIISRLPKERVLVETDGPYVKIGRRTAEPKDVWTVIDHLSVGWGSGRQETAMLVEGNLRRLLDGL
jgi:TatD DNase family protein